MTLGRFAIWLLANLFWFEETAYFGWNWAPASDAEVICDGIVILIFALMFVRR